MGDTFGSSDSSTSLDLHNPLGNSDGVTTIEIE